MESWERWLDTRTTSPHRHLRTRRAPWFDPASRAVAPQPWQYTSVPQRGEGVHASARQASGVVDGGCGLVQARRPPPWLPPPGSAEHGVDGSRAAGPGDLLPDTPLQKKTIGWKEHAV